MNLDTLLRDSAAVPDAAPRVLISGRTTLDAAITAAAAQRVAAIRVIRQRRRRRLSVTALVAAAAAFAFVIAPTLSLGGKAPVSAASAAQVMRQAAAAAGAQPGGWPDAAYWHSVSTYHQGSEPAHQREAWIGHTAPGVLTDDGVDTGFIPLDEAVFPAGGRGLSWDELYALPTDSVALESNLRAGIGGVGNSDDAELFVIVGDLLRESPASPALRQALWEVAARIPGVTLVGAVTDSAGRAGVAVERGDQRYVLDPNDGRLLEESSGSSAPAPEAPGGTAWRATYLEQGPANSAPATTWVEPTKESMASAAKASN